MNTSLTDFYENMYEEEGRLFKDKKHRTEFILTVEYIDKYLKKGMKILELGAGTGAYSLYYAKQGYEVHSLELLEKNLSILKSKITEDMNIFPVLGNALDLSMYEDNTFDMVLCLGPMYHLEGEDRVKCLKEAVRVTKPDGLIYVAYISNNFVFVKGIKKFDRYIEEYSDEIQDEFRIKDSAGAFTFMYPKGMEELVEKFNLEKIHHLTTDGISDLIKERINNFTDHEFNVWIEYLKHTAEFKDQLGYGEHLLWIGKKV